MKTIELIALSLAAAGLITAQVGRFGSEYKVQVSSVSEVFAAEAVATDLKAKFGIVIFVAF